MKRYVFTLHNFHGAIIHQISDYWNKPERGVTVELCRDYWKDGPWEYGVLIEYRDNKVTVIDFYTWHQKPNGSVWLSIRDMTSGVHSSHLMFSIPR